MPEMNNSKCLKCEKPISTGKFIEYPDKSSTFYHSNCFNCATPNCTNDLTSIGVVLLENETFCPPCYRQTIEEVKRKYICKVCNQKLVGKVMVIEDFSVHKDCFVCYDCRVPLENFEKLALKNGFPTCENCIGKAVLTEGVSNKVKSCKRCNGELDQNSLAVGDSSYHKDCFKCYGCGEGFGQEKVVPAKKGGIYHIGCFNDKFGQKCEGCGQFISGKYMVLGEKNFHPECLEQNIEIGVKC